MDLLRSVWEWIKGFFTSQDTSIKELVRVIEKYRDVAFDIVRDVDEHLKPLIDSLIEAGLSDEVVQKYDLIRAFLLKYMTITDELSDQIMIWAELPRAELYRNVAIAILGVITNGTIKYRVASLVIEASYNIYKLWVSQRERLV